MYSVAGHNRLYYYFCIAFEFFMPDVRVSSRCRYKTTDDDEFQSSISFFFLSHIMRGFLALRLNLICGKQLMTVWAIIKLSKWGIPTVSFISSKWNCNWFNLSSKVLISCQSLYIELLDLINRKVDPLYTFDEKIDFFISYCVYMTTATWRH